MTAPDGAGIHWNNRKYSKNTVILPNSIYRKLRGI